MTLVSNHGLYWVMAQGPDYVRGDECAGFVNLLKRTLAVSSLHEQREEIQERVAVYALANLRTDEFCSTVLKEWCECCISESIYPAPPSKALACIVHRSSHWLPESTYGCVISSIISERISCCETSTLDSNSVGVLSRLRYLLTAFAGTCTYERTGDTYIHGLLRSKLKAWRVVLLPMGQTPYDDISSEYKEQANDLVRPHFEEQASEKIAKVEWGQNRCADNIHLLAGIMREVLDCDKFPVYSNTDICIGLERKEPFMFSTDSSILDFGLGTVFGISCGSNLQVLGSSECMPLDILGSYILLRCRGKCSKALKDFGTAILVPADLPSDSSLYSHVNDLEKAGAASI